MVFLSQECLHKLVTDPGKYKFQENSTIALFLNEWWWEPVAAVTPAALSANLITVGAVFPNLICMFLVFLFGFPVPSWIQAFAAFAVFFFQTADSVDGKQARKLGTSSPLGDYLDHTVDMVCLAALLCTVVVIVNVRLPLAVVCMAVMIYNSVIVHWEAAKIGEMIMDDGSSITEGQFAYMAFFLVGPIVGAWFWVVPILPILTLGEAICGVLLCLIAVKQVVISLKRTQARLNGKSPAKTELAGLFLLLPLGLEWAFFYGSQCSSQILMVMLCIGTIMQSSVTLHRLTNFPLSWKTSAYIIFPGLVVPLVPLSFMPQLFVLYSLAFTGYFQYDVVSSIAEALKVPIFANPPWAKAKTSTPISSLKCRAKQ